MFCSHCGAAATDGEPYCASCGRPVAGETRSPVTTMATSTVEETPARQGRALPIGESANATNDLRDSRLIIGALVVIAATVLIIWAAAHYG